ncbi:hypothetical protein [Alteromonas facilis]|uniref:hypothetical protein n=1 Tax=Alteromonas facilis TaxID=2048004 RepID=UPI000C2813F1|nr:hypothetical protein [Alteromonas facilis]
MSKQHQQLQQAINDLPREKMPERDLWQGIELGIERQDAQHQQEVRPSGSNRWQYSVAASVAFVAVLGWLAFAQLKSPDVEGPAQPTAAELAAVLANDYDTQKQSLLVSVQDQPALTENWQEQLEELEDAAAAIKAALKQDPNNTALLKMLQNVYQQQIGLIERVHSPKWRQI